MAFLGSQEIVLQIKLQVIVESVWGLSLPSPLDHYPALFRRRRMLLEDRSEIRIQLALMGIGEDHCHDLGIRSSDEVVKIEENFM